MDNWQRAFVLHRKPYGESSLLVDIFTEESGRLTLLAKGARGKRSPWKSVLQPFTPLLVRWSGKGALKILTRAEAASISLPLQNAALYSGFYVNEIMIRLLEKETAYPALFQDYLMCLTGLTQYPANLEATLRTFEFKLLDYLGYGIDFCHCIGTGKPVDENMTYQYRAERGFIASIAKDNMTFYGKELLAFAVRDFSDPQVKAAAKRFMRVVLKNYLGDKPLKSRELFAQVYLGKNNLKLY